jgi:hypothetical protein
LERWLGDPDSPVPIAGRPGQRNALARDPQLGMRRHNLALNARTLISG